MAIETKIRWADNTADLARNLKEGLNQIEAMKTSVDRLVKSMGGDGLFRAANQVTAAVAQLGGVSKLTGEEQARVNATLERAIEKYEALGQRAPTAMRVLAAQTKDAAEAANLAAAGGGRLSDQFKTFDNVLGSLGIQISSEIRGLKDIEQAAGKTAGQFGAVATTGLVAAAALGGWKIGRLISDFFDLDTVIGNATASLLGWGDAAGEAAAAKADVLALASRRVGYEVKDMAAALAINQEALHQWRDQATISAEVVQRWSTEIARVTKNGDLPQLTKDLDSQNFSLKELAQRYGVTVEALQFFTRETQKATEAEKAQAAAIDAANKKRLEALKSEFTALQQFNDALARLNLTGEGWKKTLDTIDGTIVEGAKYYLEHGARLEDVARIYELTDVQVQAITASLKAEAQAHDAAADAAEGSATNILASLKREQDEYLKLIDTANRAVDAQKPRYRDPNTNQLRTLESNETLDQFGEITTKDAEANRTAGGSHDVNALNFLQTVQEYVTGMSGGGGNLLSVEHGLNVGEATRLAKLGYSMQEIVYILTHPYTLPSPLPGPVGPRIPGFANGVLNFAGGLAMVGERGPELVNLPGGSSVYPNGGMPSVVHAHISITGVIDTNGRRELARVIDEQLTKTVRQDRYVPPT